MKILAIVSALLLSSKLYGQDDFGLGLNQLNWLDVKDRSYNSSIALNCYLLYLNFGVDYRFSNPINSERKGDFLFMGGIGYLNYYQIQIGKTTTSYTYLRQRSEWTLAELNIGPQSRYDSGPWNNLSVSLFADKCLNDPRQDWILGFGVGYCIRATSIAH